MTRDYDFIGFTYGGKHSIDDFGIYRTSDGNRYNDNLIPPLTEKTADIPGGDGQYFFGSHYKSRQFSIPIAFDNLTEAQYQQVKKWLNGKEIKELVFDERPYKVYSAKVTGTPQLKTVCFNEGGQRIYKGEGTIQFTCYYPFAHTPNLTKSGEDGRSLKNYALEDYPTREEWALGSGLTEHIDGINLGDIPAPFVVKSENSKEFDVNDKVIVGELEITILENCSDVKWDSKTGLVYGIIDEAERIIRTSGKSHGAIPLTSNNEPIDIHYDTIDTDGKVISCYLDGSRTKEGKRLPSTKPYFTIEYNYWYY